MTGGSSRGAPEFSVGAFGGELREISDALCDLGAELGAHLDKDLSGLADGAITALRRHACNVSIVGQVKSGKSSLLNALIRQPALLPTGPDPLTAVVTRVHFGTPDQPRQGARFSFFDPDEWDRLAHSGGRLRELAERLLPNFSQEALRTQLAEMRQRVSTELGPKFEELLGTAHDFPEISPDVLADYITAKGAGAQGAGNFAAITRTADLFFDNRGIGAPLTLVDTPGTNDPYLVREEITLRMIEDTEACIVVIPALDPVGISDLGLLRFLRGLHKERLIVFVNRIDELEQPARDIAEVNRRVRRVLSYEFPETHIPIIFGSARWAQLAMSGTPDALGDAELRRLLDYAAFLLEPDPGETSDWEKNAQAPHVRDRLLFHCSGVGELEVNLSWLMSRGSIGTYAHEVATTFATLAEGMMLTVQTELQAMQRNYDQELQQLQSRQDEVRKEADRLADVLARLEATQAGSLSELDRTEMKIRPELEARLRREIYAFARDQKEKLIELKRSGQLKGSSFHCETNPLRDRLADVFARNFRVTRQSIVNTQRLTAIRMRQLLSEALPDLKVDLDFNATGGAFSYPPLTALGQMLAVDLEQSWWAQWWRRKDDAERTGQALEELVLREYLPIAEELVAAAERELVDEVGRAKWQISLSGKRMTSAVNEKRQALDAMQPAAIAGPVADDEQSLPAVPPQPNMVALERKFERLRKLNADLTDLAKRVSKLVQ